MNSLKFLFPKIKKPFSFLKIVINLLLSTQISLICCAQNSTSPGTRQSSCMVTYKNTLYLFGGVVSNTVWATKDYFHSADLPFTTDSIPWKPLNYQNAINVCDAACIVEESLGYMLVIGGGKQSNESNHNPGLQVYNFNTGLWNEPNLVKIFDTPDQMRYYYFNPRATFIQKKIIFIWGGTFLNDAVKSTGAWELNLNQVPFTWTQIQHNSSIKPSHSSPIATFKGNAFIFGSALNSPALKMPYIYNPKIGFIIAPYEISFPMEYGVAGIMNDVLYILILDVIEQNTEEPILTHKFDLKILKFDSAFIPTSSNISHVMRARAAWTQFPGSDAILIYGGSMKDSNGTLKTLDQMLIYNMTTAAWSNRMNIVTHIPNGNYTLPLVNGLEINPDPTSTTSTAKPVITGKDGISMAMILGIICGSVVFVAAFGIILVWLSRNQNRTRFYQAAGMTDHKIVLL
ncbi:hypothetical protein G9A89_020538 [Geosiphon pyriformis]|nr:hypothetical protein G9A89_020538 [Geosiphon pyriformis]